MKLALAPMATLSHEALRILIHRWGDPDEYFSEMIHAPSFVAKGPLEKWYVRTAPAPGRMVWQLTGSEADSMEKAAGMLASYGGIGLDINMGCSAPEIAKSGAGIAWMSKPLPVVQDMVRRVRAVVPGRLSVKLRLGESEDYPRLVGFCRALVDSGVELVTLHPRVRSDKYSRLPRREYIARLAADLPVSVYGNGDLSSPEDAIACRDAYPCAGFMIGRAAVQKPWIFGSIRQAEAGFKGPGAGIDHLEVSRFFLDTLAESQPPEFQITRARRFFFYYCDNWTFAHYIKMKIQNADSVERIRELLDSYFSEVPDDRYT